MAKVYLALYKGKKSGKGIKVQLARLTDWTIRKLKCGQYSHCEIAIAANTPDYFNCLTASLRDGGVRCKYMKLPSDKWDLIPLPEDTKNSAFKWFNQTNGAKYDYWGALGVVLPFSGSLKRWFCSEWCAVVLGLKQPERFSPNDLAKYVKQNPA